MLHNEKTYILFITASLILAMIGIAITLMAVYINRRSRRHRARMQEAEARRERELRVAEEQRTRALQEIREKQERELLTARIEVQESALQLVSMELHDNVIQQLSVVRMLISNVASHLGKQEPIQKQLRESSELAGSSIDALRNISHIFSGKNIEDIGLSEAIEKEMSYLQSLYGLRCSYHPVKSSAMPDLDNMQTLLLFRIVQETLQNVVRHARATTVACAIDVLPGALRIRISDNGKGMEEQSNIPPTGMGLKNIRERVQLLNGRLDIRAAAGGGCAVSVTIDTSNSLPAENMRANDVILYHFNTQDHGSNHPHSRCR